MVTKTIFVLLLMALPAWGIAQLLEFQPPAKLSSPVNSTGEESLPMLSPDGQHLYFTRALYAGNSGGKFSGLDVWFSRLVEGAWKNASNTLPVAINNEGHNAIIGMSNDGYTIYFMSARTNEKMNGIYVTRRINQYWTRPELVPVPGIDNQGFLGVYVSPDFDVMLFSMKAPDSRGEEDLYFSVKNSAGQWSAPRNMGATLNTRGYEISPFLSKDKKRLYFSSNGHGGEGDADIFYSERLYNSWETWSVPVNLGKTVNSKKFDAYFSIYGDSIAYFSSNRDGLFADIYEVRVSHARTVLTTGQRYLSEAESNQELGGPVSRMISFSPGSSTLTAPQKELLFYIANKLQLQRDILIHLVVEEEDDPGLRGARLLAIADHLVQSGIQEERIITDQVDAIASSEQAKIELRLIK